ncbi:MAG: GNAT family N-acetyltransferase [Chthoniobacteraceae bacterium]
MHVRKAERADAPLIAAVIHRVQEIRAVAGQDQAVTTATVAANLARIDSSGESSAYVVENETGEIAGYCAVHWVPFLFLRGGEAYVTELFIRPADTGRRLGTTLLEVVVAEAKRRGCARLSLLNGRDGASYQRQFYRQLGWVERDRMANFILPIAVDA